MANPFYKMLFLKHFDFEKRCWLTIKL